jgi:hypothetical protein
MRVRVAVAGPPAEAGVGAERERWEGGAAVAARAVAGVEETRARWRGRGRSVFKCGEVWSKQSGRRAARQGGVVMVFGVFGRPSGFQPGALIGIGY